MLLGYLFTLLLVVCLQLLEFGLNCHSFLLLLFGFAPQNHNLFFFSLLISLVYVSVLYQISFPHTVAFIGFKLSEIFYLRHLLAAFADSLAFHLFHHDGVEVASLNPFLHILELLSDLLIVHLIEIGAILIIPES